MPHGAEQSPPGAASRRYHCDEAGIHHRVCKAVLETEPGRDCYGVVSVFEDRIVVDGADTFASGEWPLRRVQRQQT